MCKKWGWAAPPAPLHSLLVIGSEGYIRKTAAYGWLMKYSTSTDRIGKQFWLLSSDYEDALHTLYKYFVGRPMWMKG